MGKSQYGKNNPKPDHVLGKERDQKKLAQTLRNERDALKFRNQMNGDLALVVGFSYRLSLRLRFSKPQEVTNVIVFFRKPMNRELVEKVIKNAFV